MKLHRLLAFNVYYRSPSYLSDLYIQNFDCPGKAWYENILSENLLIYFRNCLKSYLDVVYWVYCIEKACFLYMCKYWKLKKSSCPKEQPDLKTIGHKCSFGDRLPRLLKLYQSVEKPDHQGSSLFSLFVYSENFLSKSTGLIRK